MTMHTPVSGWSSILYDSSSLLRSLARLPCPMHSRHSTRVFQVTGCLLSPSSHLCRIARHAASGWKGWLRSTALITPPWNWRARDSFSQSAQTFSTTLTDLPLTPTKLCSCHISGLFPARRETGKHSSVSANSVYHAGSMATQPMHATFPTWLYLMKYCITIMQALLWRLSSLQANACTQASCHPCFGGSGRLI